VRRSTFVAVCAFVLLAVGSPAATGASADASDIAVEYVKDNANELGLTGADVNQMSVADEVTSSHTGTTHVYLQQTHKGIAVHNGLLTVNVAESGWVISTGNRFVPNIASAAAGQQRRGAAQAAEAAARSVGLRPANLSVLSEGSGPSKKSSVSAGGIATQPITAELFWNRAASGAVRLAWNLLIHERSGDHVWSINVDAESGAVLSTDDFVDEDDTDAIRRAITRPSGKAGIAARTSSAAASVADGSSYRVFPLPFESPSDGDRVVVAEPASDDASPFGWHDTNGAAGAESTRTRGNNVHAYTDRDNNNTPDPGSDPDGGAGLDFDFALDLTNRPDQYSDAAVTNLFYWNNIIHDVLHGYGFDEASGNFQVSNYGNGGTGGDDVRAEAQDGSGRNNANFLTLAEGSRPRMQMFEWRSAAPNPIVVHPPSPIEGTYFGPMAGFGQSLVTTGPISGEVVYVGRGCDPDYPIGNTPPIPDDPYLADPDGKIALIDRGTCTFVSKVKKAQDEGALMVIVANNAPGPPTAMGGADPTITIPSVMVSQSDGNLFRDNDPFNATISDGTGGAPDRDSDLDSGVIAHEYGHGVSNRLTGGPANVGCLNTTTTPEQMGEGWSDFYALTFTTSPSDTSTTRRGVGSYVSFQPPDGPGIRPRPYTTDMTVNDFTYGDIPAGVASGVLTVPHGIGFVWNSMLWEVYWNLVEKHGYNANIYEDWTTGGNNLAIQLVTDGLKFQPCRPGFVDGRDAILAADVALTGGENQCAIWQGFAKRGLGFSASQGTSASVTDGVEAMDLPVNCVAGVEFGELDDPIEPLPAVNDANAGSDVPVKFTLSEEGGAPNADAMFGSQEVNCDTLAASGPIVPVQVPGSRALETDGGKFSFNWKTEGDWEGTCRQLIVRLEDNVEPIALFEFH
jgi:extracellular elastinolytic metalloproteinase